MFTKSVYTYTYNARSIHCEYVHLVKIRIGCSVVIGNLSINHKS